MEMSTILYIFAGITIYGFAVGFTNAVLYHDLKYYDWSLKHQLSVQGEKNERSAFQFFLALIWPVFWLYRFGSIIWDWLVRLHDAFKKISKTNNPE